MTKYVGARYMPKFMGNYDATTAYEALSVVDNGMGTTYVSNKPVPAGTALSDTEYWVPYGSSSGAIINLQQQIDEIKAFVTPQMFGAVGNGIIDDTQALQDAIDAAYEGLLVIPQGIYKITSPLVISRSINIIGAMTSARTYNTGDGFKDNYKSYITTDTAIDALIQIRSSFVSIKDISLKCNNHADCGIETVDAYYSRINLENVHVSEALDKGIALYAYLSTLKLCTTFNCANYGFYMGGSAGMTSTTIESCFTDGSAVGYQITKYEYSNMISCAADNVGDSYVLDHCNAFELLNCGTEGCDNPIKLSYANNMKITGFCAEGLNLTNGVNDDGAVIYCTDLVNHLTISGLYLMQSDEYKGYKLYVADATVINTISLLDDSIRYSEIRVPAAFINEGCVFFPNPRSLLNGIMTLATSTVSECSCERIIDGNYIIDVDTVDPNAGYCIFNLATLTLDAGTYMLRGTPLAISNSSYGITLGSNYGQAEYAWDRGNPATFTLGSSTTVYIAIVMKPNASRSLRFTPELIKIQ